MVKPQHPHPMHSALREATHAAHTTLDQHPLLRLLLSPALDRQQYATVLASLAAPQALFEAQLSDYITAHRLGEVCIPRHPMLDRDLQALGQPPYPAEAPPEPATPLHTLGILYVLEGSHLGGAVIAKQVMRHLPDAPLHYFQSASNPLPRWQAFWQHATAQLNADTLPAVIDGAMATFRFYARHLTACMRYCEH